MTSTDMPPAISDVLALSPLQLGLFSMAALTESEGDPYVIAMAADVTGTLDPGMLKRCAALLLVRHPNLRASFLQANVAGNLTPPVQVIPGRVDVPWRQVAGTAVEVAASEADERSRPFDLGRGPLIRFLLAERSDSAEPRWRLVVVAHHIVIDGWSLPLLVSELITAYRAGGDTAALPPPPRPYRDYIGWLSHRDLDASRQLWREHLDGLDTPTLLSPVLTSEPTPVAAPRRTEITIGADATRRLTDAARGRGVTLNSLVQMAWAVMLSAFTDRSDVVFGVTVSGRPAQLSGVEAMVGLFINTVPLRVRLDPMATVAQQCRSLQREAATLRDHSYLGHSELRAIAGFGEMYDTLVVFENFPPGAVVGNTEFVAAEAVFRPAALESVSHFPVTIAAHLADGDLTVLVEVVDKALGAMTPESLGHRLVTVMNRLIDGWDTPLREVDVLLPEEVQPLRASVHVPASPRDSSAPRGIHAVFADIAASQPDSPALTWQDGSYTYCELDRESDRLAATLVARGVGTETPVAVLLTRGPAYVVAMLAVLKAGGVIVPVDPAMPRDRVAHIVARTAAPVVVDEALLSETMVEVPADYAPARVHEAQAAYVVFTSGTTGEPKGVVGTHGAVLAYADDHARHMLAPAVIRLKRAVRVAHAWSFTFDAAWQPLAALLHGHTVHVVDDQTQRDADAIVDTIAQFDLDMIDTTPSMFAQLQAVGLLGRVPLAVLALGGEAVSPLVWQSIRDECARTGMAAYNCYGPTETTVEAVVADIRAYDSPSIGVPTGPTSAYVLDSWLRAVPDGIPGELYLAGEQVTRGYFGRGGETSTRFVADPFTPGRRMYRTGDVVRRGPQGGLLFLGRSDDQVKIRGFRVEPAEIAAVLQGFSGVRGVHVVVRRHRSGPRLTAYVAGPDSLSVSALRARCVERLPRYMVPHTVVLTEALPLTVNGKIDEAALLATDLADTTFVAPQTPTETTLARLLSGLLDTGDVDVTADFLQLGLDSIAALSLVQAARACGVEMRARLMLECNTIAELAAAIDGGPGFGSATLPAPLDDDRYGDVAPPPVMSSLFETGSWRRFAQTMLIRLPAGITTERLHHIVQVLLDRHDVLRAVVRQSGGQSVLTTRAPGAVRAADVVHHTDEPCDTALSTRVRHALDRVDPAAGVMVSAVHFARTSRQDAASSMLLCVHHLAADVVSWYVMRSELAEIADQLATGATPTLAKEYTTYREFSSLLARRAESSAVAAQRDYWNRQLAAPDPVLASRLPDPAVDTWESVRANDIVTDATTTRRLLQATGEGVELRDVLLAALTVTLASLRVSRGQPHTDGALVALERHGREDGLVTGDSGDTSATVGLFTSVFPVRLGAGEQALDVDTAVRYPERAAALVHSIARHVAEVPARGLDYGLLRHQRRDPELVARQPQVEFNYLGRHDLAGEPGDWSVITDAALTGLLPHVAEPNLPLRYTFNVIAVVTAGDGGPVLRTSVLWSERLTTAAEADELADLWRRAVDALGVAL